MDFELLVAFDHFFHTLRGQLFRLTFTDEFLSALEDNQIINAEESYLIFASPSPTIFNKGHRIIAFLRILHDNTHYREFVAFIRNHQYIDSGLQSWDKEWLNVFKLELNRRLASSPIIADYYRRLRERAQA